MSLIGAGMAGLGSAQAGLASTSHNISNVNTPGYSRQRAIQSTNTPQFTGAGWIGTGSNISTITRTYNNFLDLQAREAQTQSSHFDTLAQQLGNVDQMLSDSSAGLSPAMDDFFSAVGNVSTSPADAAARQTLVSAGGILATRIRDMSGRLEALRSGVNDQINLSVTAVNTAARQIASLNDKIAQAVGNGAHLPNDLLDQRDALLRDMSKELRVSSVPLASGAVNVFLANGQALVLDTRSFDLGAQPDPADPGNLRVGLQSAGSFRPFEDSTLSGGMLGGALAFRSQTLDATENSLGRIAGALASAINAQHAVGQDRNGVLGGAFFAIPGAQVLPSSLNTGSATLGATVSDYNALTTSDYRVNYSGSAYTVTRLSDNTQTSYASLPQTIDGVTIALSGGTPAAGDSFKVLPTRATATGITALISDPAMIAAALPVRAANPAANLGSGAMRVTAVAPPLDVNLKQPVTITFTSATTFDVSGTGTGSPTGLTYTPGMTLSYNGWTAQLQGSNVTGDSFSVGVNTNGVGDNGNMLALSTLGTTRLIAGGTQNVGEAYAQTVSTVGNQDRAAQIAAKAQQAVLTQASSATQEVSGVNLDEEAANLLKYQQAYQAAGKIIATANTLFQEILGLMR